MDRQPDGLKQLAMEVLGLTVVMAAGILIAAFHVFEGLGSAGRMALGFTLTALALTVIPIQLYVVARMMGLKRENLQLFTRATQDGLTQVLNKTTFRSRVEAEIGTGLQRRGADGLHYTLLIVDADHFKRINDRLGHATGDQALVAISRTLRNSVRKDDIVGRIGGEEFAILLKGAGVEEARIVAERLRTAIGQISVGAGGQRTRLSVSMGGLTFVNALPYDAIYRAADANLYRAKKNGRNRVDLTSAVRRIRAQGVHRGATAALSRNFDQAPLGQ